MKVNRKLQNLKILPTFNWKTNDLKGE